MCSLMFPCPQLTIHNTIFNINFSHRLKTLQFFLAHFGNYKIKIADYFPLAAVATQ